MLDGSTQEQLDAESFDAYLVKNEAAPNICWACRIPERRVFDEARRNSDEAGEKGNTRRPSARPAMIAGWLVEVKLYPAAEATVTRIEHHFLRRHHARTGS